MMKKKVWLVLGIAGMLLGIPHDDAPAVVKVQIGTRVNIGGGRPHHHHYNTRRHGNSYRLREARRHRHEVEYRKRHHRRNSSITIKL